MQENLNFQNIYRIFKKVQENLVRPKKNKIGVALHSIMADKNTYESNLLKNNPFPLFFSAQSNHLIDFLKHLNPKYPINENTVFGNNDEDNKFKELFETLVNIEKNATLVWVILFATFFSQTTITYMNYVI